MTDRRAALHERLRFLAGVVTRESSYLAQTDRRLFAVPLGATELATLAAHQDLAERVDAFVARFGRLQDTLAGGLLPRLLDAMLEPVGSVLDNLHRAERLGWVRSASDWAELRLLRNRMIHEYVEDPAELAEALQAAHRATTDLLAAAAKMAAEARSVAR